ncbi:hypothetical protein K466DRAFT_102420 [Polyporus arcularius HHB13444]|uniref:Mug135-like C-terminal domain-containing protein n=1 Tax=Polyporus arcularius HHB13444 TaxID=1314778 RepID=A0A5C3PFP6_9APHY|nr:hypothetical protein K466DRAFT_102420 [Polyporus arcularius HHB13444]
MDDLESWLSARLDALEQRMTGRIDDLCEKVDDMRVRLSQVEELAMKTHISRAKFDNSRREDLIEVPFPDGTPPWNREVDGPDNTGRVVLPALDTIQAVATLTTAQTYGYFRGYWPGEPLPPVRKDCKLMIFTAIGCRMDGLLVDMD